MSKQLNDEVVKFLEEKGYKLTVEVHKGYDRREFFPDSVDITLSKGNGRIASVGLGTEFEGNVYDASGVVPLVDILNIRKTYNYSDTKREFEAAAAQLVELKRQHKITHWGEKKELKQKCEKLADYYSRTSGAEIVKARACIPLLEECAPEIETLIEKLREMKRANAESEPTQPEA